MNPRLISWNVKGLNQRSKRLKIRNLLRQWKADIICLQETKLELISNRIMKSLWGCQFVDWCYLPSSEAFGGILLMWDRRVVEKFEAHVGDRIRRGL
jgi:exonuclease III